MHISRLAGSVGLHAGPGARKAGRAPRFGARCPAMPTTLFVETRDHVANVVLRTGSKGNPLGPDFWRELP
jgi:hypothetical protein